MTCNNYCGRLNITAAEHESQMIYLLLQFRTQQECRPTCFHVY